MKRVSHQNVLGEGRARFDGIQHHLNSRKYAYRRIRELQRYLADEFRAASPRM
jgi:hypothetical protein